MLRLIGFLALCFLVVKCAVGAPRTTPIPHTETQQLHWCWTQDLPAAGGDQGPLVIMSVYDADSPSEGLMYFNNSDVIPLFGTQGVVANNLTLATVMYQYPAALAPAGTHCLDITWNNPDNDVNKHEVRAVTIQWDDGTYVPPDCDPGYCQQGSDTDAWIDAWDNCIMVNNNFQWDTDGDSHGNRCDGDFDQSGLVTATDFAMLRQHFNTIDQLYDLNSSGLVTAEDYAIFRTLLNNPPGPSAVLWKTYGGNEYDEVMCYTADCEAGIFRPEDNVVMGQVAAGEKCYPLTTLGVPTGVPDSRWGYSDIAVGWLTVCIAP